MRNAEIRRWAVGERLRPRRCGLGAVVDLPRKSRFFQHCERDALRHHRYGSRRGALLRLVERQRTNRALMLPRTYAVRSVPRRTAAGNRSAFVAWRAHSRDRRRIAAFRAAGDFKRCGTLDTDLCRGRAGPGQALDDDAALTSVFGTQASISLGTWKEVSDSGAGGSGFSLVDLAADRSGVFIADHGGQGDQAESVGKWLAGVNEADLLPISALALAEGMTEAEFRSRYASTDSTEFALTVQRIDETLAVLNRY
jgi:hypothetical protein